MSANPATPESVASAALAAPSPAWPPPDQIYFSVAELARAYGVSNRFIRDKISDGDLPAIRAGHHTIRVRLDDFERLFCISA